MFWWKDQIVVILSFTVNVDTGTPQRYLSGVPETLLCHFYGGLEQTNTGDSDLKRLITGLSAHFIIPVDC